MQVFVIDQNHQLRNPIHPALARRLLKLKFAAIYRVYPFTLVLKREIKARPLKPVRLKIDPGAKTTGLALLQNNIILWKAELTHRKVNGWNTGDIISVIGGKYEGVKCKRIKTTRAKGNFDIRLDSKTVISVSRNQLKAVHRRDGYSYSFVE